MDKNIYNKFQKKLSEMFMMDHAELDFGIYRIMNTKRKEIEKFLNVDLLPQIEQVLRENVKNDTAPLQVELEEQINFCKENGIKDYMNLPKVKELQEKIKASSSLEDLQNRVFSYLTIFFSRYFDGGDFISQRRYKSDGSAYLIPYNGEEVKLHWANADQYYIKTSEYFKNYTFRLPSGQKVHFVLVDASTEQNNNKNTNDWERRFKLVEQTEEQPILEVKDGELNIYFTYELMPKSNKQAKLNNDTLEALAPMIPQEFTGLNAMLTDKRSFLEKHLVDYTAKNSFDYFIHKDLSGFLSRELDFFIKNEVLVLKDLDANKIASQLAMVKAITQVGGKIISFLTQLEDFQKRLWLKKKMVVESEYCITLDRIDPKFYPEIAACEAQRQEWVNLFAIDELTGDNGLFGGTAYSVPLTVDFLKANPFLLVDTRFFSTEFKHKLIAEFDDLDEQCDGLLINSENFQALNLLQEKYKESINTIYIDPPYNTGDDGFPYKDNMQHSSWLSFMYDRMSLSRNFLKDIGVIYESINRYEQCNLTMLNDIVFGGENKVADIIWEQGRKSMASLIAINHENVIIYSKDIEQLKLYNKDNSHFRQKKQGLDEIYKAEKEIRIKYQDDFKAMNKAMKLFYKELPDYHKSKAHKHYVEFDSKGLYFPGDISQGTGEGGRFDVIHPTSGRPCKVPKGGWRLNEKTMQLAIAENRIHFGKDETTVPCYKRYLKETEYEVRNSVFYKDNRGSSIRLKNSFGKKTPFPNPKDEYIIQGFLNDVCSSTKEKSTILDYFAGSGTTGHAVINLNREDGGKRKYIVSPSA